MHGADQGNLPGAEDMFTDVAAGGRVAQLKYRIAPGPFSPGKW